MNAAWRDPSMIESSVIVRPEFMGLPIVVAQQVLPAVLVAEEKQNVFVANGQEIRTGAVVESIRQRGLFKQQLALRLPRAYAYRVAETSTRYVVY